MYKMTQQKWEGVMKTIKDSVENPESIPDDVILLSLSQKEITEIFTKRRLELLNTIKIEKPGTISELARKVKRELPAVDRDLKILESYGIVSLEKSGREVKPLLEKELLILPLVEPLTLDKIRA